MKVLFFLGLLALPSIACATTLDVTATNIPDAVGTIRIAVCTESDFLKPDCKYHAVVQASAGQVKTTFLDVQPGVYAVQVFQDRNGNQKLDQNFLGIPKEPLGFSRSPSMHFGPPSFTDAAFSLGAQNSAISLALRTK
ncbi:hypothetical protein BAR24_14610 [Gluconobacter oxydans]|uniref:DUF2141 domain-containing protein n=1 Tax=Gluconobacter thailandicus TaxID=257438 RepID=UPI0002998D7D|nr:DUF2141 domain-containing protein [Gluconobacter thailandicus]AFW01832.1 hypothetical protein B932_2270 [Gluconobacter oxydans H24]ANQ42576.1 hypothetical protein BAR24_14610 [Gluconobacter oxydans]